MQKGNLLTYCVLLQSLRAVVCVALAAGDCGLARVSSHSPVHSSLVSQVRSPRLSDSQFVLPCGMCCLPLLLTVSECVWHCQAVAAA